MVKETKGGVTREMVREDREDRDGEIKVVTKDLEEIKVLEETQDLTEETKDLEVIKDLGGIKDSGVIKDLVGVIKDSE